MSFPTTLGLRRAHDLMGIKDAGAIEVSRQPVSRVLIVGDLSESVAGEPIEARACSGLFRFAPGGGTPTIYRIASSTPGGIVIERVRCSVSSGNILLDWHDPRDPLHFNHTVISTGNRMPTGGIPPRSVFDGGTWSPFTANAGRVFVTADARIDWSGVGFWIPPGWSFFLVLDDATAASSCFIHWRELTEGVGPS